METKRGEGVGGSMRVREKERFVLRMKGKWHVAMKRKRVGEKEGREAN